MGQKVNAVGLRIGINRGWEANWYASKKDFASFLKEDIDIRRFLEPKLKDAMLSHIDIARNKNDKGSQVIVTLHVGRPGAVIGQEGANLKTLRTELAKVVKTGNLTYKEQRERQKQREREKELRRFQADAYSILKGYWLLLTEAAHDCLDWHFEEALQELPVVEYRLQCLRECPGEYFADRKAVRRLGEIQRRIAGWNDRP